MNIFNKYSDSVKTLNEGLLNHTRVSLSRKKAHKIRKEVVKRSGKKLVNRKKIKFIKRYSKDLFGSSSYWPWLALYSEIRGEFMQGWIPQDYYRFTLLKKYNPDIALQISESKTLDYQFFPEYALKPLFIRISGIFYTPDGDQLTGSHISNVLNEHGNEIVIKEAGGWQGKQITFTNSRDFSVDQLPNKTNIVVQPVIKQHHILHSIHPNSVNTIRVFTYLKNDGTPTVKFAKLRFGSGSMRVDNSSSGGGFCFIKENGYCESWYYDGLGFKRGTQHPDTKTVFSKIKIPNYHQLLDHCLKSHKKFPYARFIGWDVAVNAEGTPVLIEWNTNVPSLWLNEAISGPHWNEIPT